MHSDSDHNKNQACNNSNVHTLSGKCIAGNFQFSLVLNIAKTTAKFSRYTVYILPVCDALIEGQIFFASTSPKMYVYIQSIDIIIILISC